MIKDHQVSCIVDLHKSKDPWVDSTSHSVYYALKREGGTLSCRVCFTQTHEHTSWHTCTHLSARESHLHTGLVVWVRATLLLSLPFFPPGFSLQCHREDSIFVSRRVVHFSVSICLFTCLGFCISFALFLSAWLSPSPSVGHLSSFKCTKLSS